MKSILVVNNLKDWNIHIEGVEVVTAKSYLTTPEFADRDGLRIYNICRSNKYQSIGYYVSLLAEARGHKIVPDITTIQDLKSQSIMRIISEDIEELIQKKLAKIQRNEFELSIYFGKNTAKVYDELSRKIYSLFQAPLLKAHFVYQKKWVLQGISPLSPKDIPDSHFEVVEGFAREHFSKKRFAAKRVSKPIYDMAILYNEKEKHGPSNKKAIQRFIQAAESIGFYVDTITKEESSAIAEYDALFIRETTEVNHHTYRLARRAAAEGLVVIDDPLSILRCTNKVYLNELLNRARVPVPKTLVVHRDNIESVQEALGVPCVLKKPDSSFSQGVVRVDNKEDLKPAIEKYLDSSELILAQEYTPTDFDWRIGVLDKTPLFACKYYMAKGHWQIYNWQEQGREGDWETLPVQAVPDKVIQVALRASNLIGDGLYGVDVKQSNGQLYVIEVNDNPNIDAGVEDAFLKEELYRTIARSFFRRLEYKRWKSR